MGFNGGWTTVCALAILLQTLIIVIMVGLSGSSVYEEVGLHSRLRQSLIRF